MALNEDNKPIYLNVAYGKIRQRCGKDNPKAVERKTQDGEVTYALEYKSITGKLEGIKRQSHDTYGESWIIYIRDKEMYALQIKEDSAYGRDLLRKIPNLKLGNIYEFRPYEFTPKGETDKRSGLSIYQDEVKIESYYHKTVDGKTEYFHGFPEFKGDKNNKNQLKKYYIDVNEFLVSNALRYLNSIEFKEEDFEKEETEKTDLPF